MKRGATLIEFLVCVAIIATIIGIVIPAVRGGGRKSNGEPHKTIQMTTVQHDDHWWILCRESFSHHPDCPCRSRTAEAR